MSGNSDWSEPLEAGHRSLFKIQSFDSYGL